MSRQVRERERENINFTFPYSLTTACNSKDWIRRKSGGRNSSHDFHVGTGPSSSTSLGHWQEDALKLRGKEDRVEPKQSDAGCGHPHWGHNTLCYPLPIPILSLCTAHGTEHSCIYSFSLPFLVAFWEDSGICPFVSDIFHVPYLYYIYIYM